MTSGLGKNLVLALEEPESHLHPNAIHQLKGVLQEIATRHQVIMTTHCPLFVDRTSIRSNILVNNRMARPARSIQELRMALGVRAADNLQHAELILLVEGDDDREIDAGSRFLHAPRKPQNPRKVKPGGREGRQDG